MMDSIKLSTVLKLFLCIAIFSQQTLANITDSGDKKNPEKPILTRIASFIVRPRPPATPQTPEPTPAATDRPDTPRPPMSVKKPLCTLVMPRTVRLGGFLGACEGDVVTLMQAENVPEGQLIARNSCPNCGDAERQGRVLVSALELNQHTGNVYLEIGDFLVANPLVLAALIENINAEECEETRLELLRKLVDVLAARRVLGPALEGLIALELEGFVQVNELFRNDETPAMILIRAILRREGPLMEFRCSLVRNIQEQSADFLKHGDIRAVIEILKACQKTLVQMPANAIPEELTLVLGALKKALRKFVATTIAKEKGLGEEHVPLLLGAVLYLRILSPTITQPGLYLNDVPDEVARAMVIIGQALQFVGNRADPTQDRPLFAIAAQLRTLYDGTAAIINRIIGAQTGLFNVAEDQVTNAATLYRAIVDIAEELIERDSLDQEAFERLKVQLGVVPRLELLCDDDVPRINEIRDIRAMLRKMLPKRFSF